MVRKNIPTIREPPLYEILRVNQRGFGYLNPEVGKSYLETIGLGPCIGVYVRDRDRKLQALAHIDSAGYISHSLGRSDLTNMFLAYLKNKQLTEENFDEVLILKSQQANREDVDEVYSTLKMRGHKPEIIEGDYSINVIFDKEGNMYWVDPETIQAEEKSDAEWKLFGLETMGREGLKCEDTGEIIKYQSDPIYPKLNRTYHIVKNGYGAYGVRIPVRGKFDKRILGELKQEGLRLGLSLSLRKYEDNEYIQIAKEGYPASEDTKAVIQVNNLAAKLVKKIYEP